jgi:hypothetical protein
MSGAAPGSLLACLPPPPAGCSGWPWTEEAPPLPAARPDGSPWPAVSVVTPSLDQGRFLEQAIRSVLLQGYPRLEYVVMDGGSHDGSTAVLRRYERFLDHWESGPDGGQTPAINAGFARCGGELLNWLCADDYLLPGALAAVADAAALDHAAGLFIGAGCSVDAGGRTLYERWCTQAGLVAPVDWVRNWFFQPSAFFRRAVWEELGPLDGALDFAMDLDFYLRASPSWRFVPVHRLLSCSREHAASKSVARRPEMFGEIARVQARHGGAEIVGRDVADLHRLLRSVLASWPCRLLRRFLPKLQWNGLE